MAACTLTGHSFATMAVVAVLVAAERYAFRPRRWTSVVVLSALAYGWAAYSQSAG